MTIKMKRKSYRLTQEDFITRCIEVHGDKYDYSKVEYKGSTTPVIIICPEHGEFRQKPTTHLNSHGCPKCGMIIGRKKTTLTIKNLIPRQAMLIEIAAN